MLGISIVKKSVKSGMNFIGNINDYAIKVAGVGDKFSDTEKMISKYLAANTGAAGLGKGISDTLEAIKCQDGTRAVISGIGCMADSVQILASFVPGPNLTFYLTSPVSLTCKVFVWCCKRGEVSC